MSKIRFSCSSMPWKKTPLETMLAEMARAGYDGAEAPLTHGYARDSRGLGVAEMARSIQAGRVPRASAAMAFHVVEVAEAVHVASRENRHVPVTSTFPRPEPMPVSTAEGDVP